MTTCFYCVGLISLFLSKVSLKASFMNQVLCNDQTLKLVSTHTCFIVGMSQDKNSFLPRVPFALKIMYY